MADNVNPTHKAAYALLAYQLAVLRAKCPAEYEEALRRLEEMKKNARR